MKVAICQPVFWPEVRRGAERLAWELARGLGERGHGARIVTAHAKRPARTSEGGVEVVRGWRPPFDARLERRAFEPFLPAVPATYLALRRGADDVAQALQPVAAVAAARWSRATGRPAVFAYMGIPHRAAIANRRLRLAAIAGATRECAATTALSEYARDAFHHWLGIEARVIHPPVDTDTFTPGPARSEQPTVVFAGDRAEPRKRFALAVAAWQLVRREYPGARLLVDARGGGSGPLPTGVEAVAMDDPAALARIYASAWASLLPSWGEAFGLVLAEALACGTPAVGAALHGIPEVLGDEPERIGALFAGDEPAAVARALLHALELVRDPATAQACRARGEQFSRAHCAARHEALYYELCA